MIAKIVVGGEQHRQDATPTSSDQSLQKLCKIAGASLMLAGVLYVWAFAAQYLLPAPSSNAAADTLQFVASYSSFLLLSYWLFSAANAHSIVGALGIYTVTSALDRSYAALGAFTLAVGLMAALFSNTAPALISLAKDYAGAATEAEKQVFATAAAGVSATINPLVSSTIIGVGVIFVSLALMKGRSGRGLAFLGFVEGSMNIVRGLPPLAGYSIITVVFVGLSSLWIFGVGRMVYRKA